MDLVINVALTYKSRKYLPKHWRGNGENNLRLSKLHAQKLGDIQLGVE